RIVLSLGLAGLLIPYGLEAAAGGAVLGMVIGELAGLLVLWRLMAKERRGSSGSGEAEAAGRHAGLAGSSLYRSLLGIAVPVTGSRLIGSLSYLLESILIARSLAAAGLTAAAATAQYGALQGMVIPVLLLPGVLTHS